MRLNLSDPQSICEWYKVAPNRYAPLLRHWLRSKLHAAFWPAIAASREMVKR